MSGANLKCFGLIALAEISRQPGVDCAIGLLVVTLMQLSNEKGSAGQREAQNVQFEEKRSTRKYVMGMNMVKINSVHI